MISVRGTVGRGLCVLGVIAWVLITLLGILEVIEYLEAGFPGGHNGFSIAMAMVILIVHFLIGLMWGYVFFIPAKFILPADTRKRKRKNDDIYGSDPGEQLLNNQLATMSNQELARMVGSLPTSNSDSVEALAELINRNTDLTNKLIDLTINR